MDIFDECYASFYLYLRNNWYVIVKCKICETEIENNELFCPLCGSYSRISPAFTALLISVAVSIYANFFVENSLYQVIILLISIPFAIKNLFTFEKEKKQMRLIKEANKDKIAQRMRKIDLKTGFFSKLFSIKNNSEYLLQNKICVIMFENDTFEITYDKKALNFSLDNVQLIEVYKEEQKIFYDIILKDGVIFTFRPIGKEYEKFLDFTELYKNKIQK